MLKKNNFTLRKASINDLERIIQLLSDDSLGKTRQSEFNSEAKDNYIEIFNNILANDYEFLAVLEMNDKIVGTCHLTILNSLTYSGMRRLNIEAVRIDSSVRGENLGALMFDFIKEFAIKNRCYMLQLTTNKLRGEAANFYKKIGFVDSHIGMKLIL